MTLIELQEMVQEWIEKGYTTEKILLDDYSRLMSNISIYTDPSGEEYIMFGSDNA